MCCKDKGKNWVVKGLNKKNDYFFIISISFVTNFANIVSAFDQLGLVFRYSSILVRTSIDYFFIFLDNYCAKDINPTTKNHSGGV